jgi:hypothetical protein
MPMMGMNGVPPHLSSALYQSVSSPSGLGTTQDCDYWSGKIPPLSATNTGLGNGMAGNQSANAEQKIVRIKHHLFLSNSNSLLSDRTGTTGIITHDK